MQVLANLCCGLNNKDSAVWVTCCKWVCPLTARTLIFLSHLGGDVVEWPKWVATKVLSIYGRIPLPKSRPVVGHLVPMLYVMDSFFVWRNISNKERGHGNNLMQFGSRKGCCPRPLTRDPWEIRRLRCGERPSHPRYNPNWCETKQVNFLVEDAINLLRTTLIRSIELLPTLCGCSWETYPGHFYVLFWMWSSSLDEGVFIMCLLMELGFRPIETFVSSSSSFCGSCSWIM
jgi:hypothetical protein